MRERDFQNMSGPGQYRQDQLANCKPREPTYDDLHNRLARTEVSVLELDRLRCIEAGARSVVEHAFAKDSELEMWDEIHALRAALEWK